MRERFCNTSNVQRGINLILHQLLKLQPTEIVEFCISRKIKQPFTISLISTFGFDGFQIKSWWKDREQFGWPFLESEILINSKYGLWVLELRQLLALWSREIGALESPRALTQQAGGMDGGNFLLIFSVYNVYVMSSSICFHTNDNIMYEVS